MFDSNYHVVPTVYPKRDPVRFRDLKVGDTFDFIAPTGYNSFFHRCTKVSARKYSWDAPKHLQESKQFHCSKLFSTVGSIDVEVYHVNAEAQ